MIVRSACGGTSVCFATAFRREAVASLSVWRRTLYRFHRRVNVYQLNLQHNRVNWQVMLIA